MTLQKCIFLSYKLQTFPLGGMGMGMATQLELISVYACCSTRAVMRYMEGGDIVPYVRSLPTKTGP